MGEFHNHPDGYVIVRGGAADNYVDSPENFAADFGVTGLPELPDGADDHIYTQGKRHAYMGGGNIIKGGDVPWQWGDDVIAALPAALAAQAARNVMIEAERVAALAAMPPQLPPGADIMLDFENRLRALEGEKPVTMEMFEQRFRR